MSTIYFQGGFSEGILLLTLGTMCPIVLSIMSNLTADIKCRVEPLTKQTLMQIAEDEQRDLSEIVRRAYSLLIKDYTRAGAGTPPAEPAQELRHG